jgi:hypothetical protein
MRHIKLSVLRSQIYRPNQKEDESQYLFTFATWSSLLIPVEPGAEVTLQSAKPLSVLPPAPEGSRVSWDLLEYGHDPEALTVT